MIFNIYKDKTEDFVIEKGVSGNWHYAKWNSGRMELWERFNWGTKNLQTTEGSMYKSGNWYRLLPEVIDSSLPMSIQVTANTSDVSRLLIANCLGVDASNRLKFWFYSTTSGNVDVITNIYINGRWK